MPTILNLIVPTQSNLMRIRSTSLASGHGFEDLVPTIEIAMMLLAMTSIVSLSKPYIASIMLLVTCLVVGLSSLRALRQMWTVPVSDFSINYCWVYDSVCEHYIRWEVFYFVSTTCGILVHPVGYAFLLFDICMMSPTLQNVLKSIVLPARQLVMTAVLVLCFVYVFSFVSVIHFRQSFLNSLSFSKTDLGVVQPKDENYECQSLGECFVKQIHHGLITGTVTSTLMGGGYDYKFMPGDPWLNRVVLDLTFWLIISIFMMNIVLGVIVDTFSALRTEQNERETTLKNICFICGTHRSKFDALAAKTANPTMNFETHIRHEHNMWSYIKFLAYIRNKCPTEHTGSESEIASVVADKDTSWVPSYTSITLRALDAV